MQTRVERDEMVNPETVIVKLDTVQRQRAQQIEFAEAYARYRLERAVSAHPDPQSFAVIPPTEALGCESRKGAASGVATCRDPETQAAPESPAHPDPTPQPCVMCTTGKSERSEAVLEAAWTHIRGKYSWQHRLVADRRFSIECTCPGYVVWLNHTKLGARISYADAFSAGIAWQAKVASVPQSSEPHP
jgi:hypothetical protein